MQFISKPVAIALILLVSGCAHEVSPSLEGHVIDRDSLMPINHATVKYTSLLARKSSHITTDAKGVFVISGHTLLDASLHLLLDEAVVDDSGYSSWLLRLGSPVSFRRSHCTAAYG